MTPHQRIIIIALVCLSLLGNATNFYLGKYKGIKYVQAFERKIDSIDIKEDKNIEEDREEKLPDLAESLGHLKLESDFDANAILVTKAYNFDGTEHNIKNCKLIHVNWCTDKELQKLPGIGPVLAERIIEERKKNFFIKHEDLLKVKGIGIKRLDQIRNLVCMAIPDVKKQ